MLLQSFIIKTKIKYGTVCRALEGQVIEFLALKMKLKKPSSALFRVLSVEKSRISATGHGRLQCCTQIMAITLSAAAPS